MFSDKSKTHLNCHAIQMMVDAYSSHNVLFGLKGELPSVSILRQRFLISVFATVVESCQNNAETMGACKLNAIDLGLSDQIGKLGLSRWENEGGAIARTPATPKNYS